MENCTLFSSSKSVLRADQKKVNKIKVQRKIVGNTNDVKFVLL